MEPLLKGYYFDLRGEGAPGEASDVTKERVPVFGFDSARFTCRFNAKAIETVQNKTGRSLGAIEHEAIAQILVLLENPKFYLDMNFEPGDIQLLYNYRILHTRTAYTDYPEPERRRLLYRLWLQ